MFPMASVGRWLSVGGMLAWLRTLKLLSVEFADVGGWLAHGDFAMGSCAQFLAVAERR